MRSALKIVLSGLGVCVLPALPSVLVTLASGSQVEASSATRSSNGIVLTVASGTITLCADQVVRMEQVADPVAHKAPLPVSQHPSKPEDLLSVAGNAQALPAEFLKSVAKVESGMRLDAVSQKGAVGLMQLMPRTALDLGVNAATPAENALGGAKYLRQLLLRYKGDTRLALAAYNAGPAAVERYHGVPPYPETVAYVARVLREYQKIRNAHTARQTDGTLD